MAKTDIEVSRMSSTAPDAITPAIRTQLDGWSPRPLEPPAGTAGGTSVTCGDILRYKWMMLLIFFVLAPVGAIVAWLAVPPEYRAQGNIEVSPVIPRLVFESESGGLIPLYQQYLNTQVEVIHSPTVLREVLKQDEVCKTDWFRHPRKPLRGEPPSPLERLLKNLDVRPRHGTQVIEVKFVARDPDDAVTIVNTVVRQYARYISESAKATDDLVYQELLKEYESRRRIVEELKRDHARLVKELNTAEPTALLTEQRSRLNELETQLETLRREIALAEWDSHKRKLVEESEGDPLAPNDPTYEHDPEWCRLFVELLKAHNRLETARQRWGDEHSRIIALRNEVTLSERLLEDRVILLKKYPSLANTRGAQTDRALDHQSLEEHLKRLNYQEELLQHDVTAHNRELELTADAMERLARHDDELRHQGGLFETIRTRKTQREIESAAPGAIRVQAEAFRPSKPHNQRRRYALVTIAVFAAAALSLVTAGLRARLCRTVRHVDDVAATREPFLGYLPHVRNPRCMTPRERAVQLECARMIRTTLLQGINGKRSYAVMITSAGPGAGKTETTLLLAHSLAQCGKHVLLVDTDLRNPSLAQRCEIPSQPGLVEVLNNQVTDHEAIVNINVGHLDLLPAGRNNAPRDSELLADHSFGRALLRWRDKYDIVLLDSAPVMPVADTRIVASQVDGTIMVMREQHCRRAEVGDAVTCLTNSGGHMLGMILVGSKHHSRYYYQYETSNTLATAQ